MNNTLVMYMNPKRRTLSRVIDFVCDSYIVLKVPLVLVALLLMSIPEVPTMVVR